MQEPDERSHGSGIRNANSGQTSDRQELPKDQHGDSRRAQESGSNDNGDARQVKNEKADTRGDHGGPGRAEDDTQEMDADGEEQKIERLSRDPVEGPPSRK